MDIKDISKLRLINQQITKPEFETTGDVVRWMGAMQAQDYAMAKWAVGSRSVGLTERDIDEAINSGEIFRTHLLRPTWHFVSPDDIYWILALTAPRIKASLRSRHAALGLNESIFKASNEIIEEILKGGKELTRDAIIAVLKKSQSRLENTQAYYHLLLNAELDALICSGATKGKEQSFALLAERQPEKKLMNETDAIAELVRRYFKSHGPATLQDFSWWSGLSVTDIRKAIMAAQPEIIPVKVGKKEYWFSESISRLEESVGSVHLLAAFDEFIIGYRDRSPSLHITDHASAISSNGVFRPVIVVNGQVAGIWKRTMKKSSVVMEMQLFKSQNKSTSKLIEKEAIAYGDFFNKNAEVIWN